ncbi:PWI domain-containing protein [Ceratocystis lukuohia]|uniref:PWI domain-containing protein n=1 Tax=Ceratocystis lukuohia TaxID=2019550 RepID=A0ABR4MP59_9PEZI
MATGVDAKLLKSTKFPPEFNRKVDIQKVNVQVLQKWIASRISEVLGNEDDVVIELCYNLLEGSRFPDIKALQIQLTGFLAKDTPTFCKELWNLCLSAQDSPQGVPKELLEAKKQELIKEKIEADQAEEQARRRREDIERREREQRDRFRGRGDSYRGRGASDRSRRGGGFAGRGGNRSRSPPSWRSRDGGGRPRGGVSSGDHYAPRGRDKSISRSPSRSRRRDPFPQRVRALDLDLVPILGLAHGHTLEALHRHHRH